MRLTEQQIRQALRNVRGMTKEESAAIAERARKGDAHANFALSAFLKR